MLILLPPSEGKTAPATGPMLDLQGLSFPEFTKMRKQLITELAGISKRKNALEILGVGASIEPEVRAQADILNLPCARASELYTGVLFTALNYNTLSSTQRAVLDQQCLIFSGLFGATRLSDYLPQYRLAMGTKLPKAGNTATLWRQNFKKESAKISADFDTELTIDCRSGSYRVWLPETAREIVTVNAFREQESGKLSVISHNAKHYRGILVRAIAAEKLNLKTAAEFAELAKTLIQGTEIKRVELVRNEKILSSPTARTPQANLSRLNYELKLIS
ncbi:MAG: peroxide stress protein YaaA [Arcanobacterium sp.]|nr:peroxide stress protein YaaA [Arcanobacterium sp.]